VQDAAPSARPAKLPLIFYNRIFAAPDLLYEIAAAFRKTGLVEAAYVKPAAEPPINRMQPAAAPAPAAGTPKFSSRQDYLNAAPGGIDAAYAWTQEGGKGAGVNIVDVEGAWRLTHEDLLTNNRGLLGGTHSPDRAWRNHGTAVIGVLGGTENNFGVTGICPEATVGVVAIFPVGSSVAIREAADKLNAGDILLIELHRPGPRHDYQSRDDQAGYIAVEWWPDDFDAIQYAIGRGVIVVEAAGNGAQDLDEPLYETPYPDPGFPSDWKNPFRRENCDSGTILVGAGAPPPNTHGNNHGPDRSRLDFSNYGSAVDAQGWGCEVTTCGYGDLQGGVHEDRWYTDQFSGTSSASPIVVGALGCVQGVRRAGESTLLTPATARTLLRSTGSPQKDAPGRPRTQRIGNRPDLRQLLAPLATV
jgi:subtilisin family serine protease